MYSKTRRSRRTPTSKRSAHDDEDDATIRSLVVDPEVEEFNFKTKLLNGFPYYVQVNEVHKSPDGTVSWDCTLRQVTDNTIINRSFVYPPEKKNDNNYTFWKNLKKRKNSSGKRTSCRESQKLALKDIQEELDLLQQTTPSEEVERAPTLAEEASTPSEKAEAPTVIAPPAPKIADQTPQASTRHTRKSKMSKRNNTSENETSVSETLVSARSPTTVHVVAPEENTLVATSTTPSVRNTIKKPQENEWFESTLRCSDGDTAHECLENPQGGLYRTIGKIKKITNKNIIFELHRIQSFNRENKNKRSWFKPGEEYTLEYDPKKFIWKYYQKLQIKTNPVKGRLFKSRIACNVQDSSFFTNRKKYVYDTCLTEYSDESNMDLSVAVVGIITAIEDEDNMKGIKINLFTEDGSQEIHNTNNLTLSIDFTIDYNPLFTLWSNYETLNEDGKNGPVEFELKDAVGDGDCFYHAIYHALKDNNLLYKLKDVIKFEFNTKVEEHSFIRKLRKYLSDKIDLNIFVTNFFNDDQNVIDEKIKLMSSSFQTILQNKLTNDDEKVRLLKTSVATPQNEVCEPEVVKIIEILMDNGIILTIHSSETFESIMTNKEPFKFFDIRNRIIILNQGNFHYQYFIKRV